MSGFSFQQVVFVLGKLQEMNSPVAPILAKKWANWNLKKKEADHRAVCACLQTAKRVGVVY